jgi:DNA-binding NarL/FixJ family response regulator
MLRHMGPLLETPSVKFGAAPVNGAGASGGGRELSAPRSRPMMRAAAGRRHGGLHPLRVLIVDDHPIVIAGCKALLAAELAIEVLEAADWESGYSAYFAARPDVAVIDLNLPGLSGLELCRRILRRDAEARVMIFSMNDDPVFAARAIEAGAKGYIAKNDDPLLFVDAVRRIADGGVYLRPEMAREVAFIRSGPGASPLSALNAREREIIRLLASGKTMAQIAHVLNVSYKTVANNCTLLKHKLGARSAMDLMRLAVGAVDITTPAAR